MAASMKFFVACYFGVLSAILAITVVLPIPQDYRGTLTKTVFNILAESVFTLNSIFIWKQISSAIDYIFAQYIVCRILQKCVVVLFLVAAQFSFFTNLFLMREDPHSFSQLCYACLGTFVQLGIWLAFANIVVWILKETRFIPKLSKKSKSTKVLLACLYALSISMYGLYNGTKLPGVKKVNIPIKNLDKAFHDFKIVQINDIHLGPTVGRTRLQGIIDIVDSLQPDAVVIVGDLTDGKVSSLRAAADPLRQISAPYGSFYVTGNHEYMTNDVDNWFKFLSKELGINVLHNSHHKVSSQDDSSQYFYFAGTDDVFSDRVRYEGHSFDLETALRGCDPSKPVILLAHQPIAAKRALDSTHSNIQLVLSGHTHGGQMFPVSIGAWLVNPFFSGLYSYKNSHVYVSEGTVFWGIPMRIFTSMEITEILLKVEK